mgnify:FL=1
MFKKKNKNIYINKSKDRKNKSNNNLKVLKNKVIKYIC